MTVLQELDNVQGVGALRATQSEIMVNSHTDLFTNEHEEQGVIGRRLALFPSNVNESPNGPYTVNITREGDNFSLDPQSLRTHMKLKLQKQEGDGSWVGVTHADNVSIVNNITSSLFRRCECYINSTSITSTSSPSYAYKAQTEKMLSYSREATSTVLANCLYEKDEPDRFEWKKINVDNPDDATDNWAPGLGMKNRTEPLFHNKEVELSDTLHCEISAFSKLLPCNVDIKLVFDRNDDDFCLITSPAVKNTKFRLKVIDFWLSGGWIELHSKIINHWNDQFNKGSLACFPYTKSVMRCKAFPKGVSSLTHDAIFSVKLPYSIMSMLVASEAMDGSRLRNPFYFNSYDVNSVEVKHNSVAIPPTRLQPDFANKNARNAYRHLFENIGIKAGTQVPDISYSDFLGGFTMWPFDLTGDFCNGFHKHFDSYGRLDASFGLDKPLTEAGGVTLITMGYIHDVVYLDRFGRVVSRSELTK